MRHASLRAQGRLSPVFTIRYSTAQLNVAILILLLIGLCGMRAARAQSSAEASAARFHVVSPSSHAELSTLPVEIKLYFPEGSKAQEFRAKLNGVDVTRRFGPFRHGFRRARFFIRHLRLGTNFFTARDGSQIARVTFTVQLPSGPPGSAQPQANYISTQTRIMKGDGSEISDYGIQVGGMTYFAPSITYNFEPTTGGMGFQMLVLDRASLKMVSNTSFGTTTQEAVTLIEADLKDGVPFSGCGEFGCLVFVQSFRTIGAAGDSLTKNTLFTTLGSAGILKGELAFDTTYSLIASVNPDGTAPRGTAHERVCNLLSVVCKSATLSGALILDNYSAYRFASPSRVAFSTGTTPNSTSNTVTVGAKQYASSAVPAGQGGFQLVVLDGQTLQLISNQTFSPINSQQLSSLSNIFANQYNLNCASTSHNVNCPVFILSSIGNVAKPTTPNALSAWRQLNFNMRAVTGSTYSVFDQLGAGDDYALVGSRTSADTFFPTTEASSVISRAIQPAHATTLPSTLQGVLALDHQNIYTPTLANLTPTFNVPGSMLDKIALQAPVAWPYPQPNHPGQQAAYTYLSLLACKCSDIRAGYNSLTANLNGWNGAISTATYQDNPSFSENDFELLQTQLETETNYAVSVQELETNIVLLYTGQNSNVGKLLLDDYTKVEANLYQPPPPDNDSVGYDVVAGLGALFGVASYVSPFGPELQGAFGVASIALNLGEEFSSSSSGAPALNQKGILESTYGNLATDAVNSFADGNEVVGNTFDRIFSDWGRLQALGEPLYSATIKWDPTVNSAVLDNFDRSTREQYLISLMAGVFLIEHDSENSSGAPPTHVLTGCNGLPPGEIVPVDNTNVLALPAGTLSNGQPFYDGYVFWDYPTCPSPSPQPVSNNVLGPLFAPLDPFDQTKLGEYAPKFYVNQTQIPVFTMGAMPPPPGKAR